MIMALCAVFCLFKVALKKEEDYEKYLCLSLAFCAAAMIEVLFVFLLLAYKDFSYGGAI